MMKGILKYNEKEIAVNFEKKPILDVKNYKWECFSFSFNDIVYKRTFQYENPDSIIIQRITESGIIVESFEILKIKEIIPSIDLSVIIYFDVCYLMN
jgi:hypothetical protein